MSAAQVVVDADFLSAFLKIEQLFLVRDFYQTNQILIPPAVYREVSQTSLLQRLAGISWIQVEAPETHHLEELSREPGFLDLGAGEKEAIALALQLPESVLLMNDNRARRQAQLNGIQAVNIPAFLLACKLSGFLSRDTISKVIRDLQEKVTTDFGRMSSPCFLIEGWHPGHRTRKDGQPLRNTDRPRDRLTSRIEIAAADESPRLKLDEFPGGVGAYLSLAFRRHLDAPPAPGSAVVWLLDEVLEPHGPATLAGRE